MTILDKLLRDDTELDHGEPSSFAQILEFLDVFDRTQSMLSGTADERRSLRTDPDSGLPRSAADLRYSRRRMGRVLTIEESERCPRARIPSTLACPACSRVVESTRDWFVRPTGAYRQAICLSCRARRSVDDWRPSCDVEDRAWLKMLAGIEPWYYVPSSAVLGFSQAFVTSHFGWSRSKYYAVKKQRAAALVRVDGQGLRVLQDDGLHDSQVSVDVEGTSVEVDTVVLNDAVHGQFGVGSLVFDDVKVVRKDVRRAVRRMYDVRRDVVRASFVTVLSVMDTLNRVQTWQLALDGDMTGEVPWLWCETLGRPVRMDED